MEKEYLQLGRKANLTITNLLNGKSIDISELRVTFKIGKAHSEKNKAQIEIYNLSPASRTFMEVELAKDGTPQLHVELRAGYKSEKQIGILFKGRCYASSTFKAPDWVTALVGSDGAAQYKYTFEKKYIKGTPILNILKDLASATGMDINRIIPMTDTLKKTRTFSGDPQKIIKNLQKTYGFTFDTQDESIIIKSNRYALDLRYIVTLNPEKGLLGVPRSADNLVIVDSLINTDIRPQSYIDLQSPSRPTLKGMYSIQKVDIIGDSYSGAWTMTSELLRVTTPDKIETKGGIVVQIPSMEFTTSSKEEVIQELIELEMLEVNTCMPARVISYDASTQTCTVQPAFKRTTTAGVVTNRAEIEDVPVIFSRSGAFGFTIPIMVGDSVLLLFSQRSMDDWIDNGGEVELTDFRRHDFTDAIALAGLFPLSGKMSPAPATDSTEVRGDKIMLGKTGASAEPMVLGNTLKTNLEDLISSIEDLIALITAGQTLGIAGGTDTVVSTVATTAVEASLASVSSALANQNSDFIFGEKS